MDSAAFLVFLLFLLFISFHFIHWEYTMRFRGNCVVTNQERNERTYKQTNRILCGRTYKMSSHSSVKYVNDLLKLTHVLQMLSLKIFSSLYCVLLLFKMCYELQWSIFKWEFHRLMVSCIQNHEHTNTATYKNIVYRYFVTLISPSKFSLPLPHPPSLKCTKKVIYTKKINSFLMKIE